ncbi:MAG: hypothetical protein WAW06_12620 [bacterium]
MRLLIALALVITLAAAAYGLEKRACQMREDFGAEPLADCYMNYYYYIPCPTHSWFWEFYGWTPGAIVGEFFTVGDPSMGRSGGGCPPYTACDPYEDLMIDQLRVLDFAGYGTLYPGLFTVEFSVFCADPLGCPVGPTLWASGSLEMCTTGWNYVGINRCFDMSCFTEEWGYPRFLVTARHIGRNPCYPKWGFDNISVPVELGCQMHDSGCCPAPYPRPAVSHYGTVHSGYYGVGFEFCPPQWILDGRDTTGDTYGFVELAWRLYLIRSGITSRAPSTWGAIKSMYR